MQCWWPHRKIKGQKFCDVVQLLELWKVCFLSTKKQIQKYTVWSHNRSVFSRTTAGTGETRRRVSRSAERSDVLTLNKTWSTSSHTKRDVVTNRLPGTFVTQVIHPNIYLISSKYLNLISSNTEFCPHSKILWTWCICVPTHIFQGRPAKNPTLTSPPQWEQKSHTRFYFNPSDYGVSNWNSCLFNISTKRIKLWDDRHYGTTTPEKAHDSVGLKRLGRKANCALSVIHHATPRHIICALGGIRLCSCRKHACSRFAGCRCHTALYQLGSISSASPPPSCPKVLTKW